MENMIPDKIEYELIRQNPYEYILNYADMKLIIVGRQAFKILALMPHSLFLPDISGNIISNISCFTIGNPGTGKSTLNKMYSKLVYNPLIRRTITEADLIQEASNMKWLSIGIEDLSQTADDYGVIKALEGLVGEERAISKSTLRDKFLGEAKAIALFGVTPQDLERFAKDLESGLLSRCAVVLIRLTQAEQKSISDFMIFKSGDFEHTEKVNKTEEVVIDFYEELKMILRGKHKEYLDKKFGENHGKTILPSIKGYNIKLEFLQNYKKNWDKISENMQSQGQQPNSRDLASYQKFLVSLAFLNIHNRKCENGILEPNESDHRIALELAVQNMKLKWGIPLALKYNRQANNLMALEKILNSGIPEVIRDVMVSTSKYGNLIGEFKLNE